jgi:hypothetical protein
MIESMDFQNKKNKYCLFQGGINKFSFITEKEFENIYLLSKGVLVSDKTVSTNSKVSKQVYI